MNKKKNIFYGMLAVLLAGGALTSCERELVKDSKAITTSVPYIVESYAESFYVSGVGSGNVFTSIPDTIALLGDSVVGFEGGFGGVTGKDFIYLLKSDITSWPDTVAPGGYALNFQKFNQANYKALVSSSVVLAAPIAAPAQPGPTNLNGTYRRTSNGYLVDITRVFDGVYVIANPGGAGVPPSPYLLYNYRNSLGLDSLSFSIQPNPCGGGLKLVAPIAPIGLTAGEYDESYPPSITSLAPITVAWKIFEFPEADAASVHPGAALCQWGFTATRTFVKQ